jgi:hypothetical protein
MKTLATSLFISFALIGGAAHAADNSSFGDPDNQPFQGVYGQNDSSASRDQVQGDLQQAKASGQYLFGDVDNATFQPAKTSSLTRGDVQAQLAQAKQDGTLAYGELQQPAI